MNIPRKNACQDELKFRHEVAKEIVRVLALCGASYEDAKNIFEIVTWRMSTQTVQLPDD